MGLKSEIDRFKTWAASHPQDFPDWESDYYEWGAIFEEAKRVLGQPSLSSEEASLLLFALARDNEGETIRDLLEEYPDQGVRLASFGLRYGDEDARWQLADFLGTQSNEQARQLLRQYVDDAEEYVRRRALLAAANVDPKFAEERARVWVDSPHDYSRRNKFHAILEPIGSATVGYSITSIWTGISSMRFWSRVVQTGPRPSGLLPSEGWQRRLNRFRLEIALPTTRRTGRPWQQAGRWTYLSCKQLGS